MKYTDKDFIALKTAIEYTAMLSPETQEKYRKRNIRNGGKVKDISMRYRWDCFWAAVDSGKISYSSLSQYKDSHTDTALRRIVPTIE